MYTILVNKDNTLTTSVKERIIQGSKNVNKLHFLVDPLYDDVDMSELIVVLTYILPVSQDRKTLTLVKSEELYKNKLEYVVSLNDDENLFTFEHGDIPMWITFLDHQNSIVRYTVPTILTVEKKENVNITPNKPTTTQVVDDIYFDRDTNQIYLTSGGSTVGRSIPIASLANAIVDTTYDGLINVITD